MELLGVWDATPSKDHRPSSCSADPRFSGCLLWRPSTKGWDYFTTCNERPRPVKSFCVVLGKWRKQAPDDVTVKIASRKTRRLGPTYPGDLLYNFSDYIFRPHLPTSWHPLWDLLHSFSSTAPDHVCGFLSCFSIHTFYKFHAKCILLYPPMIYHFLHRMFGDPREMVLHYFLADDTVEIREIVTANSGRDAVPLFLRRQKLPKVNNEKFNWKMSWNMDLYILLWSNRLTARKYHWITLMNFPFTRFVVI